MLICLWCQRLHHEPTYTCFGTTWKTSMTLCLWHGRGLLQTWLLTQNTWVHWRWAWAQEIPDIKFLTMSSTGGTRRSRSRIGGLMGSIVRPTSPLQTSLMCCGPYRGSAISTSLNVSSVSPVILAIALGWKGGLLTRTSQPLSVPRERRRSSRHLGQVMK